MHPANSLEQQQLSDVGSIWKRVNQLIAMQHPQQETLAHIIPIPNVTRYVTQVNRQYINLVMEAVEKTHQDITMLYKSPVHSTPA